MTTKELLYRAIDDWKRIAGRWYASSRKQTDWQSRNSQQIGQRYDEMILQAQKKIKELEISEC